MFKVQRSLSIVCACAVLGDQCGPIMQLAVFSCLVDNPFSVTGADAALKFLANFMEGFFYPPISCIYSFASMQLTSKPL